MNKLVKKMELLVYAGSCYFNTNNKFNVITKRIKRHYHCANTPSHRSGYECTKRGYWYTIVHSKKFRVRHFPMLFTEKHTKGTNYS